MIASSTYHEARYVPRALNHHDDDADSQHQASSDQQGGARAAFCVQTFCFIIRIGSRSSLSSQPPPSANTLSGKILSTTTTGAATSW